MSHCDTFTTVGGDKEVCQDYVQAYRDDTVIVTDGCGSPDCRGVDVGARLINHYFGSARAICEDPDDIAHMLGLEPSSLYCTMLKLSLDTCTQKLIFLRYGDGFVVLGYKNMFVINQYSYARNAPYYVGYELLGEQKRYLAIEGNSLTKTTWVFDEKFKCLTKESISTAEEAPMLDEEEEFDLTHNGGLVWAGISSDGLDSFIDGGQKVETNFLEGVILPKFFSFKNLNGNFLKRRAKAALRELKADGYLHLDDISIGAIVI